MERPPSGQLPTIHANVARLLQELQQQATRTRSAEVQPAAPSNYCSMPSPYRKREAAAWPGR